MPKHLWIDWSNPDEVDKIDLFGRMGYKPHAEQIPMHQFTGRLIAVHGGWRSGKSESVGRELAVRVPDCSPYRGGAGRIAICAQKYDETHAEMLACIKGMEALNMMGYRSTPRSGKWIVKAKGIDVSIETISLQDGPEELSGTGDPFDIVCLVEWGLIQQDMMTAALGRLSETGGLLLMAGTLRDTVGWQADLFRMLEGPNVYDGARFSFPTWENRAIYPGGRSDENILHLERTLPPDEFARVVAAQIPPSPARIYPEFTFTEHVAEVGYRDDIPVELAVDAGYSPSHYAVLALQSWEEVVELKNGSMVRMEIVHQIDEVWENGLVHEEIYNICKRREWWGNVKRVVLGHEGRQHHAAKSTQEAWQGLLSADGSRVWVDVHNAGRILDGVLRVKTFLKDPGTMVSRYRVHPQCKGTLHEFQQYKRKTNTRGEVYSDEPKDRDNDCMDALRVWMVDRYGYVERPKARRKRHHRVRPARG